MYAYYLTYCIHTSLYIRAVIFGLLEQLVRTERRNAIRNIGEIVRRLINTTEGRDREILHMVYSALIAAAGKFSKKIYLLIKMN